MKDVWFTFCLVIKCKMQSVGQTIDQFWSRWNNYKSDWRKHSQGATCMQQHFFNHFCTSGHCGFLRGCLVNLTTTGEAHLKLWHYLGLILKKVSSSFITNILDISNFIGLVHFEDKDFRIYH